MSGPRLLRSTAVFSSMTLLSRLAGFGRDMLQATLFGTGGAMSAFIVAYRIPNFLRRVFAEGSMAMAFVPVLNEIKERGDRDALRSFIDHMAGALCAVVMVVCALGMLAAPLIARLFAPGWADHPELLAQTAQMLRITFPYLLFISMMSLAASILNSTGRFGLPAFTPVLHNLTMIAAMFWLAPRFEVPPVGLAWGVLVAGVLQLVLLWSVLGRLGLRPRLRPGFGHPDVRKVARLMLPTLFSSSVAQVNLIVGTAFASLLAAGSVDWLYYSDRLVEFPLGLFGVALGTVILPHLSRRHAAADAEGYNASLDWALRMALLAGLPAGLGLLLLAEPITATVYNYGHFTSFDTRMAAYSLSAMSLGVPAFMLSKVLAPAFFSRQDSRTPMRAAIWTVVANVVLTVAIVTPLWRNNVPGSHAGIALATALAGMINAWLLWRVLRQSGLYRPAPGWGRFALRLALACGAMAVTVLAARSWIGEWTDLHGVATRVGWLMGVIAAGGACYGLVLFALGLRPRHLRH
ncbi:murein biosynthesis integral membrane protein MurJ [Pseudoxanthomonas daejeonensis]|uniref:Probable lipid II flippase MurJ n=1 Tax=Pseudoxanthomonas daejeonensis TaxID=266062 RepID=A0ABQ6Z5W5_9GAMM|nr:murein biosynthesis integral membrane protein MurJ [Pseudoxanthomonas daejeonensis]KAF1693875.1 murein biosynthesis integral membrane protein MurJ [Pseudoxanthomonas daejeonensis]